MLVNAEEVHDGDHKDEMTKFSVFLDTLLPNGAWNRRVRAANSPTRLKYWALRLGLLVTTVSKGTLRKVPHAKITVRPSRRAPAVLTPF